jgi:hypothetical protein
MTRIRTIVVAVLLAGSAYGVVRGSVTDVLTGTWTLAGLFADARTRAVAVPLPDGMTLIAGGTTADGSPTGSVAVYDPVAGSFTTVGSLVSARVGHTATLLGNGRVLVVGGTVDGLMTADLELFDPSSGTSSLVAVMGQPRTGHAAARLADGTVLIVGGSTTDNVVLKTAEIFDPATNGLTVLASGLLQKRTGASATTLIDGRVLVVGGNDGNADLGTAELFYPLTQAFSAVPTQLGTPRAGHVALLLPHNNGVLIAGGTSAGQVVATADLFLPAIFPDPFSYGVGEFTGTGSMAAARSRAIGGAAASEGVAFVVGGGSGNAEHYHFATIKTDKDDYAPGERAVITGTGWQPGEEVTLLFQEDPAVHDDYVLTVVADGTGTIYWDQWAPEQHDLNVRFYLTARDSRSRAQTTFTDGRIVNKVELTYSGTTIICNAPPGTCTGNLVVPSNASISAKIFVSTTQQGGNNWESTDWRVATTPPGSATCVNHDDHSGDNAQHNETFDMAAPPTANTYNAYFRASNNNACGGNVSDLFTFPNSITVAANALPLIDRDNASVSVNEGQTASNTGTWSDANAADTVTLTASVGTVTKLGTNASGTWSWSFGTTDGPNNSQTVTITADDGQGGISTTQFTLTVNNVAPTITLNGAATVNEGSLYTVTLGSVVDPGTDTVTSYVIHWGDGTDETVSGSPNGAVRTHTYADGPNTRTITVDLVDEDGTHTSTGSKSVTVNNVPPTIALAGATSVNEGSPYTLTLGAITDPGADTVTSYVIHWGDGTDETFAGVPTGTKTHTYANGPNNYAITLDLIDEDGTHTGAGTKGVTVDNVVPSVSAGNDATIDEGSAFSQSGSFTDPGADTWTATVDYGDGSGSQPLSLTGKTFSLNHTYADNGTFTVTVTVNDDAGSGTDTVQVTVNNVPPTVSAGADATINEGSTFTQPGSFTDPGTADTWTATINYGDGSGNQPLALNPDKTFSLSHTYADNGVFTVTVTVTDDDGGSGSDTVQVTVNNVPPIVDAGADATINEGATFSSTGSFTDPGADTWTATVNYGDGSGSQPLTLNADKTFSLSHTYPDNGLYTVTVTVTDDDGGAGVDTVTVTVNNAPPTIPLSGAASVNEGSLYSLSLGTVVDPGTDTVTSYTIHWGDGTDETFAGSPNGLTKTHTYADGPANRTITVDLVDEDGTFAAAGTKIVAVFNVAPTIAVSGDASVNEGSVYTLTFGTVVDPGADIVTSYVIHWGDGTNETFSGSPNSAAKTHTYAEGPNSYTITVDLIDEDGTHLAAGGKTVTVNNAAPVITGITGSAAPIPINTLTGITANFTDAGIQDTHTCSIDWDDNSSSPGVVTESNGSGSCTAQHTYPQPGVYGVLVTVTDDDTGQTQSKFEYIVVFDPNGGFVTGGGWIMSGDGAYAADPSATGKANFGFVSKYKKGSNIPEGQTEFQFKAGDLNFHSSAYDSGSLVVSNFKAQYKGTGTINGSGEYKFILTAYDGQVQGGDGVDKFRIKIMTMADVIVYDNAMGASDDIDTANPTAIGGGSVVIHSPTGKK